MPELNIVYEDDELVVIDKPSGMLTHPSDWAGDDQPSAMEVLRDQLGHYVYVAHRLDRATCGALLFAKQEQFLPQLMQQFQQHSVSKHYLALCRGHVQGTIDLDYSLNKLDVKGNKLPEREEAQTLFIPQATLRLAQPMGRYPEARYSLIRCQPKTGRTHQIRRHLKHLFHPIVGDTRYGEGRHNRLFRQQYDWARLALRCEAMTFKHPKSNEVLNVHAQLAEDWQKFLGRLNLDNQHSSHRDS